VGVEKLQEELDCVSVIKSIRQLKIISRVLLKKNHNFFIKFNKKNVIGSTTEDSDEDAIKQNALIQMKGQHNLIHR
jgi:hypothetical protein